MHPTHFARVFRAHHGTTVAEFVRKRRVTLAKNAILRGETLADVACSAGFADQSELTRAFRRVTRNIIRNSALRIKNRVVANCDVTADSHLPGENNPIADARTAGHSDLRA